ncbi:hypothetical protein [Jatrophihabitans sp.]|uniref:hypothetical protein n=1 Tax=Jatrophihabitans sp. TaxID=1932789 RepID=UPI0030C701D6|nr:hypothetical protein [Jatrophihabitans sp.]
MEREAAVSKYQELHKDAPFHDGTFANWSSSRHAETPYHFTDGVSIVVSESDSQPDDKFHGNRPEEDPGTGGDQPGA